MNSLETLISSQNPAKDITEQQNCADCNNSLSRISEQAEKVQEVALRALNTSQKSQQYNTKQSEKDSRVLELSKALDDLKKSQNFELVKNALVEKYWDKTKTIKPSFLKMTIRELVETPAEFIIYSVNIKSLRLELLHKMIQGIIDGSLLSGMNQDEESNSDLIIENATKAVSEAIDEIRLKSTASTRKLADVFERSNSFALVCNYICQFSLQRRAANIYGVCYTRICQHIRQANRDLLENLLKTEPELYKNIQLRLLSPACSEKAISAMLGLSDLSDKAVTLLRMLVKAFGAVNPDFKKRRLRTHWSLRSSKLEDMLSKLYAELPLKTKKFSERLEQVLVGCSAEEIIRVLPPTLFFLRSKDLWCLNQEQAVLHVLKQINRPVKARELAEIFEIDAERPLKQVLTTSKYIVSRGKNYNVTYSLAEKDS